MTNKTQNHEGITNITNCKNVGNFSIDNFNFEHVDFGYKIVNAKFLLVHNKITVSHHQTTIKKNTPAIPHCHWIFLYLYFSICAYLGGVFVP